VYNNIVLLLGACNLTLSSPLNGRLYSSSLIGISNGIVASGEQLWLECEPGFYPRHATVATCQEDGLWYPDPSNLDCLSKSAIIVYSGKFSRGPIMTAKIKPMKL
jgi:hypothetical protein